MKLFKIKCNICGGKGYSKRGIRSQAIKTACLICLGDGHKSCPECSSEGYLICNTCNGLSQLMLSVLLTVRFETRVNEYFKKSENIPDDQLKTCDALKIFSEKNSRVSLR